MELTINYGNALAELVGKEGIPLSELEALSQRAKEVHGLLQERRRKGELPFMDLPYQNVTKLMQVVNNHCKGFDNVVVLGIGGSGLGARALASALLPPYHQILEPESRGGGARMFVADNIDPDYFMNLLSALNLSRTLFVVISKSGGTAETMSQFMVVRELLIKKFGREGYKERMIAITDPQKGNLREIVNQDGLESLPVPEGVGGRYSVLTPVGLLPAAICGIDIIALLKGASAMDKRLEEPDLFKNPASLLASLFYLADVACKKNILVMMPYASGLLDFAEWFQQLWAESLGKAVHTDGSPAFTGSTPVRALGATDQHSQVQLYKEGPPDKLIVFIRVQRFREDARIPPAFNELPGLSYLGGKTLSELLNAEQWATEAALARAGRPSVRIELPRLDAESLGGLMFLMEAVTVFAGALYDVNPLDQPGVEEGKKLTQALMGREGLEEEKRALLNMKAESEKYRLG